MGNRPVVFRAATPSDANAAAGVYLASRHQLLPYAPLAHSDESVRHWIAQHLIPNTDMTVAVLDGEIVGLMALRRGDAAGWIDQLYLHPRAVGLGIGSQLVARAKPGWARPYDYTPSKRTRAPVASTSSMDSRPSSSVMGLKTKKDARTFSTSGAQSPDDGLLPRRICQNEP